MTVVVKQPLPKVFLGADHAGFELKALLLNELSTLGYETEDLGTRDMQSTDYPDYAHRVAQAVLDHPGSLGVLVCGSGVGMSIAANRHKGIRAVVASDAYTVEMARRHNEANVLCLGSRVVGAGVAVYLLKTFLSGSFEGGRHSARVAKIELPHNTAKP